LLAFVVFFALIIAALMLAWRDGKNAGRSVEAGLGVGMM
jgi:hypothetical protein